ncbi:hypothetical protein MYAM1_001264 [Malassezia yamatoensis]|uniref:SMP-LTD domain-containing protein n=1 Tax=Malassezia yamatoensis TaxID=253288 RepID=A0AAJ5YRH5_9BASI|nr:hypothetical protein MYAM1_001264 [Malassezia yamatoensis]
MLRELFLYLLGGVTFLPLCVVLFLLYEQPIDETSSDYSKKLDGSTASGSLETQREAQALLAQQQAHVAETKDPKRNKASAGDTKNLGAWLIVRNSSRNLPRKSDVYFYKDGTRRSTSKKGAVADVEQDDDAPIDSSAPSRSQRSYMSYVSRSLRTNSLAQETQSNAGEESSSMPGGSVSKPNQDEQSVHYAIFKAPMLYIYNGDDVTKQGIECIAKINLTQMRVSLWDHDVGDIEGSAENPGKHPEYPEGALYTKRNAIHLSAYPRRNENWYIMTPRASQLEDWYFALLNASLQVQSNSENTFKVFSRTSMEAAVNRLDDRPDQVPLRWLNAMLSRIFVAIAHTAATEAAVFHRINQRLLRLRLPKLISDVKLMSVELGDAAPTFGRPMLQKLEPNGETSMQISVHYQGNARMMLSASFNLSLGQRFKTYKVPIVLALHLRTLEGTLLLQMKPPPSNRIWYGFTAMPRMDLRTEPVISARKVRWSMITSMLENRIRESFAENIVVPHMNSIPFFNTQTELRRGGIWNDAAHKQVDVERLAESEISKSSNMEDIPKSEPGLSGATTTSRQSIPSSAIDTEGIDLASAQSDSFQSDLASAGNLSAVTRSSTFSSQGQASEYDTNSISSATSSDKRSGRKRDKYRAWLSGKVGSATPISSPSTPGSTLRSYTGLDNIAQPNERQLSESEFSQSSNTQADEQVAAAEATIADADRLISTSPTERIVPRSISNKSVSSGSTADLNTEDTMDVSLPNSAPRIPARPDHRLLQEFQNDVESSGLTALPALNQRAQMMVQDHLGNAAANSSKKSKISHLTRSLHDSMDRDGRQVMARDAKDALKRGWASWNTKRTDNRKRTDSVQQHSAAPADLVMPSATSIERVPPEVPKRTPNLTDMSVFNAPPPAPSETRPLASAGAGASSDEEHDANHVLTTDSEQGVLGDGAGTVANPTL